MTDLADLTTLRVGGPARRLDVVTSEAELVDAVTSADDRGEPVLIVCGGSNLVVSDDGFDGTVVLVRTRGVRELDASLCGGVLIQVAAGEPWDDFVARAVERGQVGIEALSGIPGSVGATPIQNVGAYGQEVAETIARVRTYDREERRVRTFMNFDCGFGYRTSRFKGSERYLVLDVTFQLRIGQISQPIRFGQLTEALGVDAGGRVSLTDVRDAVLALRRSKGMVLDDADFDTWSAGSFFTNPVVSEAPPGAPVWPADGGVDGAVKTSAAWLIEQAGFGRGYPGGDAPVTLSTKHTLAVTNRGAATSADVAALGRVIRDGVQRTFGIRLDTEPRLVGLTLDG